MRQDRLKIIRLLPHLHQRTSPPSLRLAARLDPTATLEPAQEALLAADPVTEEVLTVTLLRHGLPLLVQEQLEHRGRMLRPET